MARIEQPIELLAAPSDIKVEPTAEAPDDALEPIEAHLPGIAALDP
jgi:hypothetical protein